MIGDNCPAWMVINLTSPLAATISHRPKKGKSISVLVREPDGVVLRFAFLSRACTTYKIGYKQAIEVLRDKGIYKTRSGYTLVRAELF